MNQSTRDGGDDGGSWRQSADLVAARVPVRFVVWVCWAAGLIVLGVAVWLGSQAVAAMSLVVVPAAVALLLVALLEPLNRWLCRLGLPRGLAAVTSVLALLAVLGGVGALAGFSLAGRMSDLIGQFRHSLSRLQELLTAWSPIGQSVVGRVEGRAQDYLQSLEQQASSIVVDVTTLTLHLMTGMLLCAFLVIFLLYDGPGIWRWVTSLLPAGAAGRVDRAGHASWVALTGFVHGTFIIAVIHGLVIGTTLYLLDVAAYLPLALLVALGSFVPLVGALIAGSVSVIVTFGTVGPGPAVILLVVLLVENELEAHVLQPFVVGRYVRLHPVAIVLALAVGSVVAGVAGALLAVPLAGSLRAAWGPLNGHESIVPARRPSRLSRLWSRLRRGPDRRREPQTRR